jgi:methionine-rich copper-binding protein CopC
MPKFLLLPALAALVALASITIVEAHSRPIRFDPAPGTIQSSAPSKVTGWFTSDIRRADESFIKVLDADGNEVQTGDTELSTDRREMSAALPSGLDDGRYLVFWSTFDDADGEVFQGCYAFFVGQSAADAAIADGQALDGGADCPAVVEAADDHDHAEDADAPSVELSIPDEIDGDSATLTIIPTNFTPRAPDGTTVEPGFGHYHIYLDKVPVDALTGEHSHDEMDMTGAAGASGSTGSTDTTSGSSGAMADMPGGLAENPVMWVENSYTFTNLEPGVHTVSVVLNYDNHTAYDPPVIASQSFHVKGGSDDDSGGIPAWTLAIGVIAGLVVGGVGMKLAGSRA